MTVITEDRTLIRPTEQMRKINLINYILCLYSFLNMNLFVNCLNFEILLILKFLFVCNLCLTFIHLHLNRKNKILSLLS